MKPKERQSLIKNVEQQKLNMIDRFGLAWCRLSFFEWDDLLGEKPEEYDNLPDYRNNKTVSDWRYWFHIDKKSKADYVLPAKRKIRRLIGPINIDRSFWLFIGGITEEEWMQKYIADRCNWRISRLLFRERL